MTPQAKDNCFAWGILVAGAALLGWGAAKLDAPDCATALVGIVWGIYWAVLFDKGS